jgi:hypothetical protein
MLQAPSPMQAGTCTAHEFGSCLKVTGGTVLSDVRIVTAPADKSKVGLGASVGMTARTE